MKQIPLTQGYVALVDVADVELVSRYKWHPLFRSHLIYARTKINGKTVLMHRLILGLTDRAVYADHVNHDGLDNRRANIRVCSAKQNRANTRKYRGKSRYKGAYKTRSARWQAQLSIDGKLKHLGIFDTEREAATAYDRAASEVYGQFAYLNFPAPTL